MLSSVFLVRLMAGRKAYLCQLIQYNLFGCFRAENLRAVVCFTKMLAELTLQFNRDIEPLQKRNFQLKFW